MSAPGIFVDRANQLIFSWAMVSEVNGAPHYNTNGTHFDPSGLLKAALGYALDGNGTILKNHEGGTVGKVCFIFPVTTEVAKAMGFGSKLTGILLAIRPDDMTMLDQFESGQLTGFSSPDHAGLQDHRNKCSRSAGAGSCPYGNHQTRRSAS
jgi:hypothetical protein